MRPPKPAVRLLNMPPISDLWIEHKTRLRAYIAKRVREREAVDDILQDVFLKAHASLNTVKSQGSLAAWLYRIAANAIADHYRGQKPSKELPEELAAPEPEPDYIAELASCLQPLIADLPETYRLPLVLSEIEGLTQKEVAARLGLSLSGAKSRVQRGREKLRQRLFECCDIETGERGIVGYEPREPQCGCRWCQ
jgi:RNA polymerase sigma-70 factor, ECF subfamily